MLSHDIAEFRRLHAAAGPPRGRLTPDEAQRYAELGERLKDAVVAAQHRESGGRHPRRGGVRVRRAMRVELTWSQEMHRAVTFDVGSGGLAALLAVTPPRDTPILVRLHLSHLESIVLVARVAGARERRGSSRVSFAFTDLSEPERTRLERCLLDGALAEGTLANADAVPFRAAGG